MASQLNKFPRRGDRLLTLGGVQRVGQIEVAVVVECFEPIEQVGDLGGIEPRQADVKVRDLRQPREEVGQLPLVPVAADFVEGDVECLLTLQREVDDRNIDAAYSSRRQNLESLVAADQVARAAVPDQRLDEAELIHGSL